MSNFWAVDADFRELGGLPAFELADFTLDNLSDACLADADG
jgi:hypothetical protein